jgi:DNA-binding MarR family transcriptional regulator
MRNFLTIYYKLIRRESGGVDRGAKFMVIAYEKIGEIFGRTAQLQVLIYLLNCPEEGEYLSGIAKATKLSHSSVSRVMIPLLKEEVVIEKKLGKQIRIFKP